MKFAYSSIEDSIDNLAYQQHIHSCIDINKDIQQYIQLRLDLRNSNVDEQVSNACTQRISDLKQERVIAREYEQYVKTRIRSMMERELQSTTNSVGQEENI